MKIKKYFLAAREMAQQLRALAALPEDPSSITSIYVAAFKSSYGRSDTFFWNLCISVHTCAHAHEHTHTDPLHNEKRSSLMCAVNKSKRK